MAAICKQIIINEIIHPEKKILDTSKSPIFPEILGKVKIIINRSKQKMASYSATKFVGFELQSSLESFECTF